VENRNYASQYFAYEQLSYKTENTFLVNQF